MDKLCRRKLIAGLATWPWLGSNSFAAQAGRAVAITIDDPDLNPDDTPLLDMAARNDALLETLRHENVKAALFVCGMRVDNDAGKLRLRRWGQAGHLIGNHTYSHLSYPRTTFEQFSADALRGEAVIHDLPGFTKLFRYPMLKEGRTVQQRDQMREFLKANHYRMGYVTIDTSEWAIDARLRRRLGQDANADLKPYRDFYLEHIWQRTRYYDDLATQVLGRSPAHTLLIHHNLVSALFLGDLLQMYRTRGWRIVDAAEAFRDPVFERLPAIAPAGESIVWALAKESGRYDAVLRYPAEDGTYEERRMDELKL